MGVSAVSVEAAGVRHAEELPAPAVQHAAIESARWVRRNQVVLAAIGLIVAQLGWKSYLLSQFYFRQDDFLLLDKALAHGLSPSYLFTFSGGHLRPGGLAVLLTANPAVAV